MPTREYVLMGKPTIFFSHSSKDKEVIIPIKNKIEKITSKSIDIFMSSDGQSIPLGRNWVHKIEEGLDKAEIMFVFVTPTSINSSWIYFEAGFAYAKKIKVIPVGLGINIGHLKPPLNLLQGFDINSHDSLNNFISTINDKFNLEFKECFIEEDYNDLIKNLLGLPNVFNIHNMFSFANYTIDAEVHEIFGEVKKYNIEKYYADIKNFLDSKKISYSINEPRFSMSEISKTILVNGIRIDIHGHERKPDDKTIGVNNYFMSITVSTLNFVESFELLKEIISVSDFGKDDMWLHLYFNNNYTSLRSNIEISSLLTQYKDKFSCRKDSINLYDYTNGLSFGIIDVNKFDSKKPSNYVLAIAFDVSKTDISDVKDLILELQNCGLIYKNSK